MQRHSTETLQINEQEILLTTPDQNLIYSSAEYFKAKVFSKAQSSPHAGTVIIRGDFISSIDTTTANVSTNF